MKAALSSTIAVFLFTSAFAAADTFGTGANQFEITFVAISGDASAENGTNTTPYSSSDQRYKVFVDPTDFRIGTFEITNSQWGKFQTIYGVSAGNPAGAYDKAPYWTGLNIPTNCVSWYEAAQFVNWLNTSTGHQAAYKFKGTIHTSDYTFAVWDASDAGYDASNPYRNSNAFYFLPTENEWLKAAYWNGTYLQTYATKHDAPPAAGADSNYNSQSGEPWAVGSGSEELNGTYDMMGNIWEWTETPPPFTGYIPNSSHYVRGGYYGSGVDDTSLSNTDTYAFYPYADNGLIGFRVASVPEPGTLALLAVGAALLGRKRK